MSTAQLTHFSVLSSPPPSYYCKGKTMTQNNKPTAHTSHGEITLDQLGGMQPGLARLMAEISDRYWILYYAAKAENWKMAALQSSEIKKAFRIGEITRPKYLDHLEAFINGPMSKMDQAIESKNWKDFQDAYMIGVKAANSYHVSWNHEEIIWQLPDEPPKHLKL